jgi:hypothetical protein
MVVITPVIPMILLNQFLNSAAPCMGLYFPKKIAGKGCEERLNAVAAAAEVADVLRSCSPEAGAGSAV